MTTQSNNTTDSRQQATGSRQQAAKRTKELEIEKEDEKRETKKSS